MTLQTWLKNRWLTKHQRSPEEVADLLAVVDRDLEDASVESLRLTIAADNRLVDTLDGMRRKRNLINYERAGTTSRSEASEVYRLATRLREDVLKWLVDRHPDLVPDAERA